MQSLHYIIYKTTNLINGKVYIGKHVTVDLNDGYLGSGKLLRRAIVKYGIENFNKEILHVFDNEADMNAKEAELVTKEFVLQETNYNLCVGGQGGFSYINRTRDHNAHNRMLADARDYSQSNWSCNQSKHKRSIIQNSNKKQWADGIRTYLPSTKGRKFSDETKAKMSASHSGNRNSQFGTMWITNGQENRKIKGNDVPLGWHKGRSSRKTID